MKSKDVEDKTGLTRKAMEYYEDLGLVHPSRDENGYRHYSDEDISCLMQINIYRKLGLNLLEIKKILMSREQKKTISNIIRDLEIHREIDFKKLELLKQYTEEGSIDDIRSELLFIEAQESIYIRLREKFPGYLGQMFFINYMPFLQGKLETEKQKKAYVELVEFLDSMNNYLFTEEEKQTILDSGDCMSTDMMKTVVSAKISAVMDIGKWMEDNEEAITHYQAFKQSDEYRALPIIQLYEKIKVYLQESGYYEVAIPLIRKMSPDYDAYYRQLMSANEKYLSQSTTELTE